jgi:hypothetical protein
MAVLGTGVDITATMVIGAPAVIAISRPGISISGTSIVSGIKIIFMIENKIWIEMSAATA